MINIDKATVKYTDEKEKEISCTIEQFMEMFDEMKQGKPSSQGKKIEQMTISMSSKSS